MGNQSSRRCNIYDFQAIEVTKWEDIESGMPLYLKYYGLWHAVIVTGIEPDDGFIFGIHYGCQDVLSTRTIREDTFPVNLCAGHVWTNEVPQSKRVSSEAAVRRARARLETRITSIMGGNHSTNVNDFQRIMIKSWEEIEPGRPFYLRYYGLPHAVIVTEKNENDGCIKGIHYGYQNFLRTRTISEDEFQVNLMNGNIFRLSIPEEMMVGPGVAIQRARGKIGERRFNLVSRRSSHIVTECVMK